VAAVAAIAVADGRIVDSGGSATEVAANTDDAAFASKRRVVRDGMATVEVKRRGCLNPGAFSHAFIQLRSKQHGYYYLRRHDCQARLRSSKLV
jgi:hypothetical protein